MWNSIEDVLLTLKPNIYCFCIEHHYQDGFILLEMFAYPRNKRIIYRPELNSKTVNSVICSYKKIFSDLIFSRTSRREREYHRSYLINVATCSFPIIKIDIKQWTETCLHCQNPNIRTNSPFCSTLLRTNLCFLQADQ